MAVVNLPNGARINFPDGTPEAEINAAVEQLMAESSPASIPEGNNVQSSAPVQQPGILQRAHETLRDSVTGIGQSGSVNFGDEIQAGLGTPIELILGATKGLDDGKGVVDRVGDAYSRGLDRARARVKEAEERSPVATTAGNVVGGAALGGTLSKGGLTLLNAVKPTYASMMGRGAAEGAAYGAAYGAGAGEGVQGRLESALLGGGIGAATGGAMGAVGAKMANNAARQTIPSTDALRQQADTLYGTARQAGVEIAPASFGSAVDDIVIAAQKAGIDRTIHPKATAALNRLVESKGTAPKLEDVDLLRRVLRGAASSIEADERRIASIMIDKLDDYVGRLSPADVTAGNPTVATQALSEARDVWGRMRKGEILEDMIDRAKTRAGQFSGSGYENALRTEFRQLAMNPKRMRGFSDEEAAAVKKVAQGGPVENVLRFFGKFAPRGVVSAALSGGVGYGVGGPVGGAAMMLAGEAGRRGATAMTHANSRLAADLVRAGGQLPLAQQLAPAQRLMLESLLIGSTQEGTDAIGGRLARALSTAQ